MVFKKCPVSGTSMSLNLQAQAFRRQELLEALAEHDWLPPCGGVKCSIEELEHYNALLAEAQAFRRQELLEALAEHDWLPACGGVACSIEELEHYNALLAVSLRRQKRKRKQGPAEAPAEPPLDIFELHKRLDEMVDAIGYNAVYAMVNEKGRDEVLATVNMNSAFFYKWEHDRPNSDASCNYILECVGMKRMECGTVCYHLQNAAWKHDQWYTAEDVSHMLRIEQVDHFWSKVCTRAPGHQFWSKHYKRAPLSSP